MILSVVLLALFAVPDGCLRGDTCNMPDAAHPVEPSSAPCEKILLLPLEGGQTLAARLMHEHVGDELVRKAQEFTVWVTE